MLQPGRPPASARSTTPSRSAPTACARSCSGATSLPRRATARRPRGLRPGRSRRLPAARWDRSTTSSAAPRARGLVAAALPLHPGPRLGVALRGLGRQAPRSAGPAAREYGAFLRALGRRYSGSLRRREPGRRRAAARAALVVLERAQPAELAAPAVRAQRRDHVPGGRRRLPRDGARRHRGPARDAVTAATRCCSARPARSGARPGALATRPVPPGRVHPHAAVHRRGRRRAARATAAAVRGCRTPRRAAR